MPSCFAVFLSSTAEYYLPAPSFAALTEPGVRALGAVKFNSALAYAAERTNSLGGEGLLYPLKSSVFREALSAAEDVSEAAPLLPLVIAEYQALYNEYRMAEAGQCH